MLLCCRYFHFVQIMSVPAHIAQHHNLDVLRSCLPVHIYIQLQELKQALGQYLAQQCNITFKLL